MALLNKETGELTFMDGLRLSAGMPMGELAQRLDGRTDAIVRLESHAVAGGRLVPVCTVTGGALESVALTISSVASRPMRKAERQRAFLFARLDLEDPCPDTLDSVHIACPFGEMFLSTDPFTGRAEARILYDAR